MRLTKLPAKNLNKFALLRIGMVLHRPWSPPVPAWAINIGARLLKMEPSLALTGCRCAPKRLLEGGFKFQYPDLPSTFMKLYE